MAAAPRIARGGHEDNRPLIELDAYGVSDRTSLGAAGHERAGGVQRHEDEAIWQPPDPQGAEERVRRLEASAANLRAAAQRDAQLTRELEEIHGALALARIDLVAHRRQRLALDHDITQRRADAVVRQRREVVELFEGSERRLLERMAAADDDVSRRLDAVRADLATARAE